MLMPTLPTREAPMLAASDIVLRGGSMAWDSTLAATELCFRKYGVHGISVGCGAGLAFEEVYQWDRIQRYPQSRAATVESVLELGCSLIPTFDAPHYTLDLGRPLDEALWESLLDVFARTVQRPSGE